MNRKVQRIIICVIAGVLALSMIIGFVVTGFSVFAVNSTQLQNELDDLKKKADDIDARKAALQSEIDKINTEQESISNQKIALDKQIAIANEKIENTMAIIKQYNLIIAAKQDELDTAIEAQHRRFDEYKDRIRAMEENRNVNYVSIVLGASSFGDLLGKLDLVNDMMQYDKQILKVLSDAQKDIQEVRDSMNEDKEQLSQLKTELEQEQVTMQQQQDEANKLLLELEKQEEEFKKEYESVESEERDIQQNIVDKMDQLKKTKEEEERARAAAIAAKKNNGTYIEIDDANFFWPSDCITITSEFGMRMHPTLHVYKLHTGCDIAASYGSSIYAAKSGWVITSGTSYAYGEYIVISHGDGVATLYAHMSERVVSEGDYVLQGDTIGYVGSTGYSTGPHLHFEIQINGQYVDPIPYFNKNFIYA